LNKSPEIIAKKAKSDSDAELTKKIIERYQSSAGYWESRYYTYNRVLLRDYRMELALVRDNDTGEIRWPHRSKVFPPITYEKAEVVVPRVIDAIFSKTPWLSIDRRKGHPNIGDARKTELLIQYQLDERDFRGIMDEVIQEVVLIGNKVLRPKWVYEAEWMTKRQTIRMLGVPVGVNEEQVLEETYEGPDIDLIPFYCFHIDPSTPPGQLQKADFCIEENIKNWWEFKADAEYYGYENVAEAEKFVTKGEKILATYDRGQKGQDNYAKQIRILRYCDHYQEAFLVTTSDTPSNGILVRNRDLHESYPDGKFPYFAIQSRVNVDEGSDIGQDEPLPYAVGGFYSHGLLHENHGLQQAATTTLNQRIDQVAKGLNPPMFMMEGAIENEEDLEYGYDPGRIYKVLESYGVSIGEVMREVPIKDYFGSSWNNQMEFLMDMSDRGTGAQDTFIGHADSRNQTATGIMQLTANAMQRFSRRVAHIINRGMKPLLRYMIEMNARMIDPDTMAYVVGGKSNEPVFVSPEDIIRGASIVIHTAPFYSKEIVQERLLKTAPLLAQMHPFIDMTGLVRMILESDPYIDVIDQILPENTPPITPFMMQTLAGLLQAQVALWNSQAVPQGTQGGTPPKPATPSGAGGMAGGNIPNFDAAANVNVLQGLMAGNKGL